MTYAFAAAGTGGHVFPAIAVADALVDAGVSRDDIVFFGGTRMAASAVPSEGYDLVEVPLQGLRRSMSPRNLKLPSIVWRATRQIAAELRRRQTQTMIAFGGYVSVPAALAARKAGVRLFLHEQNAVPGLANRLTSSRAETSFIAFPEAARQLRRTRLVGNPLRPAFGTYDRRTLRPAGLARYEIPPGVPVLGVLGGSLGADILNQTAARIADAHDHDQIAIIHLAGAAHVEAVAARAAASRLPWRVFAFEDEMQYFYAAADIVLSRAGALTISELAVTGTPAVVVPYEAGAGGHQSANCGHLEAAGGVVAISETDIDQVPVVIEQLLGDEPRRAAMAEAAIKEGHPHAAQIIAQTLREVVGD